MKKLIYILLLFISVGVSAQDIGGQHYVSPTGDNGNAGTYAAPWETFQYAFDNVDDGDTIYFRGGVYPITSRQRLARTASASAWHHFYAYPGENPIIDGLGATSNISGIELNSTQYNHFKGITIRNIKQVSPALTAYGWNLYLSENAIIENCVAHNIGVRAYQANQCDSIWYINCDAYNICDSISSEPGNAGDGFICFDNPAGSSASDTLKYISYKGCRVWNTSDDGWDTHIEGLVVLDSCWAVNCGGYGVVAYHGNGFKLNLHTLQLRSTVARSAKNSIAVHSQNYGFVTNDDQDDTPAQPMHIYNNTSNFNGKAGGKGAGFAIYTPMSNSYARIFRNNIAYGSAFQYQGSTSEVAEYGQYTHSNNTWDSSVDVSDADFKGPLDSTSVVSAMLGARTSTGQLPYVDNLHLVEGSDLIDAGTDVGLPYNSSFPDMGYVEYAGGSSVVNVTSITISAPGSLTTIDVDNGTLQMDAAVLPIDATFQNVTWSVINGTGTASIGQNGVVTALSDGTVTVRATAQDGTGIIDDYALTLSNQVTPLYPTVTTTIPASIFTGHLTSGGDVTDGGSTTVTARGVCYSTSINPTLSDSYTTDGTGTGDYTSFINGLTHGTRYYVRAYATNSVGTSYGDNRQVFTLSLPYRIYFNTNAYFLNGKVVTTE